jgi:hypothetical protein
MFVDLYHELLLISNDRVDGPEEWCVRSDLLVVNIIHMSIAGTRICVQSVILSLYVCGRDVINRVEDTREIKRRLGQF